MNASDELITKAKSGDREAARQILSRFCNDVKRLTGAIETQPLVAGRMKVQYLLYLAECFKKILDGSAADHALGLNTGKKGNKADPNITRLNDSLGIETVLLYKKFQQCKKSKVPKLTIDQAIDRVKLRYENN